MIAHVVRAPILDYTGVATPVSVDDVDNDITELQIRHDLEPEEIKVWQHQWDWMTKDVDNSGGYLYGEPDERVGYKSLFGVRVTIVEPKPVAVLEVEHTMTDEEAEEIRMRFEKLYRESSVAGIRAEQQTILDRARRIVKKGS